jgi:membrane protease YdiL (CAAX protease family)
MTPRLEISARNNRLLVRCPVAAYFALTFLISWTGAALVTAPHLLRHQTLTPLTGILMFPAMLLGPSVAGIVLTRWVDGPGTVGRLFSSMLKWRIPLLWYTVLLIPPVLVLVVLLSLRTIVSPSFTPNFYAIGMLFGVPAGYLEEIGWTGYAFPKMRRRYSALSASIVLGLIWSAWHLPVIDFLGTATPHGTWWLPFFAAFAVAMTAVRVLICWAFTHTRSVLLAQLLHVSSTGALVVFSASHLTPEQEAAWYALYGIALWITVGIVVRVCGKQLIVT